MNSDINSSANPSNPKAQTFKFNPFLPEFNQNPYPIYHRLRSEVPLYQTQSFQGEEWLLTRYADIKAVLNDSRFCADDLPQRLHRKSLFLKQPDAFAALNQTISPWLFFLNPPDHTRLRGLVSKAFSLGELERLQPAIRETVNKLLDQRQSADTLDVIAELAAPLPATISALMLGVPQSDRPQLIEWSYQLFRVFDQPLSLEDYKTINQVAEAFQVYLVGLIADRQVKPQDDLLSQLVGAMQSGQLTLEELVGFCAMLFSVGQETTENFIGNSVLALLQNPEQLDYIIQSPVSLPAALDELLRFDSPVQIVARTIKTEITFQDQTFKAGGRVHLCLGAANRDPAVFPEPDRLDLTRRGVPPIPFGAGIHFCLGSVLARMQGQIALERLLQRFPQIQLQSAPLTWRKNLVLRGLASLPTILTS